MYITTDTKNIRVIEETLRPSGYVLDVAVSMQEGLARAVSGKPSVIVLKSGELSHEAYIKQLKLAAPVPVVIASDFDAEPEAVLQAVKKALTPHRVLIAEDDRQMSEILRSVLAHSGYEVKTTHDGAETLKDIREWAPHLIVLDIMLPVIDGFHVCQAVSEDHTIEHKPKILIISGRGSEWDQNLGSACGAEDYLVKPFTNADFLRRVNEVFAQIKIEG